jgi:transcriptional regulator with XRE-family HTH domain
MVMLALKEPARHRPAMSETEDESEQKLLGQALKMLRTRIGLSQDAAGKAFRAPDSDRDQGISGQAWSSYERGIAAGIQKSSVQRRLALALGTTIDQLLAERDRLRSGASSLTAKPTPWPGVTADLPIRRNVQAGAWLQVEHVDQDEPVRYAVSPDARFPHAEQWLSEVLGDSMNAAGIVAGDLVHFVDITGIGYHPRTGDIVEVERTRFQGREVEISIKQVEVVGRQVQLWPRSYNTRWSTPLAVRDGIGDAEDEVEVRIVGLALKSIRRFQSI